MESMRLECREAALFGGAISIHVPSTMVDISEFRQVPDNQEVFVDDAAAMSIIVELLDGNADSDPDSCSVSYHFQELAKENSAVEVQTFIQNNWSVGNSKNIPTSAPWQTLLGAQIVGPSASSKESQTVYFCIGLLYLPAFKTVVLITMHLQDPTENPNPRHSFGGGVPAGVQIQYQNLFLQRILSSFSLNDTSIFESN
jgi:hypothetical protein